MALKVFKVFVKNLVLDLEALTPVNRIILSKANQAVTMCVGKNVFKILMLNL